MTAKEFIYCATGFVILFPLILVGQFNGNTNQQKAQEISYRGQWPTIEKFAWRKGGFGTVMIASFTISNELGTKDVSDFLLRCSGYGPSGTLISQPEMRLYEVVEAGKRKRFSQVNIGFIDHQTSNTHCVIADWEGG